MADTDTSTAVGDSSAASTETPNQKRARLQRERRQAKIQQEGTSRLEKITKISGRQHLPGMRADLQRNLSP